MLIPHSLRLYWARRSSPPQGRSPHAPSAGSGPRCCSVALSSLFIHTIRTFRAWSPIHLLSLFTLAVTPYAVAQARYGRVAAHRDGDDVYFSFALVVTGLFTFLPGRIMNKVLFGP